MQKQIVVLSGGARKGVVKLMKDVGERMKGSCSLDFRPKGATLYIVSDKIAEIGLYDVNCEFEVPFLLEGEFGCMLRSSSITMFGGDMKRSEILSRVDAHLRDKKSAREEAKSAPQKKEPDASETLLKRSAAIVGDWTKYDGNNFYYAVKPQLDEMFVCYPKEELLESAVPSSKWVRVDAEDGYYVVGLLFDGDEPSFICYGVPEPQDGDRRSPEELDGMCVWLPLSDKTIAGYWMIYQSAKTGEIIR